MSATWLHYRLIESNYNQSVQGLLITVTLDIYFTALQSYEYVEVFSIYGATFFIATKFHEIRVIIGSTFLLIRHYNNHFSSIDHFEFHIDNL